MKISRTILIIIGALLVLCVFFGARSCSEHTKYLDGQKVSAALQDSVKQYRNAKDQAVASIAVIEVDRKQLLETLSSRDEMLAKLQAVVAADKHIRSSTVFKATATGKASGATQPAPYAAPIIAVSSLDTAAPTACPPQPIYKATVSGDGITALITAGPDSTTIDQYEIQQEYAVSFTTKKVDKGLKGLFKGRVATVEVTALSHNGNVTDVRSFEVPMSEPKRGLWFLGGAGIGGIALKLLPLILF